MEWKKQKKLGQGSYGTVYFACSTWSFAAVKTAGLKQSSSLRKEAEFLKVLRGNPYVIQCYGEDTSFEGKQGWVYNLLMEYAPGGTLDDLIQGHGGIMPEALVAYYSCMILRGIFGIHQKGMVHCDIKPSNVLVFKNRNGSNHLKLADFGLAKYVWEKETRRFRGTPVYASPESIECGLRVKASDIWSFGCTVLEMLLGGRSIWSDSIGTEDLLDRIVEEGPPEIPQYVSQLGRDFLMKCFDTNVDSRWSADKLLNHPFIKANTKGMVAPPGFEFCNLIQANNPFGSWINASGLFSSSLAPEKQPQQWVDYQLFPEKKRSYGAGNQHVFGQLFGVAKVLAV